HAAIAARSESCTAASSGESHLLPRGFVQTSLARIAAGQHDTPPLSSGHISFHPDHALVPVPQRPSRPADEAMDGTSTLQHGPYSTEDFSCVSGFPCLRSWRCWPPVP